MGNTAIVGSGRGAERVSGSVEADRTSRAWNEGGVSADALPTPTVPVNLNSITGVILLMERSLSAQRKGAEQRRDAAEASQERQEKRAVEDMRKEANAIFAGALSSGLISIAGGAMQLASAGTSAHAADLKAKAEKATSDAAANAANLGAKESLKAAKDAAESLSSTAARLTSHASILSAGGEVMNALAKGVDGVFQSTAKQRVADQTEHTNAAQAASREGKRASDMADEMGELRQKALARLEQLIDTEQQSRLAILQRA